MAYEKRFVDNLIGGMIIRIAKFGETVTAGNTVGEGAKPDAPTPEKPGPWLTLGKIKTATSERQKKTATVEGVNDAGFYEMRDLSIAQQSKLKFTTQEVTPEAIQLAFGVDGILEDDKAATPFSSSGNVRCWVYGELRNSGNNAEKLAEFCVMGDLSLTNSPNFASDPVTCEFELSIKNSPLATFTSLALAKLAAQ